MEEDEKNDETITFELIRRIQREEQRTQKLSRLPENFYENVNKYLERKKNMSNRKVALEVKNVERLVEDIFNRRERKIFNLVIISARTNIPPENLTDEERLFFDNLLKTVKERRANVLASLEADKPREKTGLVVFNKKVPAFVGSDMKNYGPFEKGDIAKLPEENKKALLDQDAVEEFEITK